MSGQYRSLHFDFSTKNMKEELGSSTKGYAIIRKSLESNGFAHHQGSGYRSVKPMTKDEATVFVEKLGKENPWLANCTKSFEMTNSGRKDYDFTDTVRAAARSAKSENVTGSNSVSRPSLTDMVKNMPVSTGASSESQMVSDNENINE